MYKYRMGFGTEIKVEKTLSTIMDAKTEMWQTIAAKIALGEIDDSHLMYGVDSLHVSCDGWTWSVDAA